MKIVKAHAYGNDFLLIEQAVVSQGADPWALARRLCDRHRGVGADGLILFSDADDAASMRLWNADGSRSEISGNGARCLAAWIVSRQNAMQRGSVLDIETEAGLKTFELLGSESGRLTFRAAMGQPEQVSRRTLDVDGTAVDVVTLRVGNPQCVVLGEVSEARLRDVASKLAVHPAFPAGSNVELASVEAPDLIRILIWERGVGPTDASGTGACAAAVAAMVYGGANRDVGVASPGGVQRVQWRDAGLYLTGWAEVLFEAEWLHDPESP